MTATPIRLVLADDHPLVPDGLEGLFRLERDLEVGARCRDGEETLRAVREKRPDVLVLGIRMPGRDGLAVLRAIKEEGLPTRVVLLTAALAEEEFLEAIRLGAGGVVLKEMAPPQLVECVRKVHAAEEWLGRRSVGRALKPMLPREEGARQLARALTSREIEVAALVARGRRNKEIARALGISEGTVKNHLHNVYEKLEVDGRLELTLRLQQTGLV
ncbi:MAG TPA: response regulator transcription factor [Vicinamibacteria bacterium]|nr:response regulator transcription factor [Vicinamibacteria bacterium]